jgi:EmrB/QacA subfamily drug resistance transporter
VADGALSPADNEAEPTTSTGRMRLTAVIVAVALFMQNLDSTVIATALPAMARSFHADPVHMSVAITAYLISLSVFIPASGWVADHFGARHVFRGAIFVFTLGSILCGIAPSLWFLVLARILQGMGGAMMLPVGRLVLLRSISRAQMVAAMAWLTMPALIGPILGPPVGGFIVTYLSWRWVFDVNIPIGVIGIVAVTLFIPDVSVPGRGGRLDLSGLVLSGLAMAALMGFFETIGRDIVPLPYTLGALAVGLAAIALYARHAAGMVHPVLDFSLLRVATFANSVVAGSLFRVSVGAMPFLLPLMLQLAFHDSPMQSGLITFASAMGAILMKPATQPILRAFGFRTVLVVNGGLAAAFIAICAAFQPSWPPLLLDFLLLLGGIFRSLQFTAFNAIAYGDIPRSQMSAATTLYATIQQLTLTLGVVIGAAVLELFSAWHGHSTAMRADYAAAFIVVAVIGALTVPFCALLKDDAGEVLSGHHSA